MDSETNMEWTENTLKNGLKDDPAEKVLFTDKVGFQQDKTSMKLAEI